MSYLNHVELMKRYIEDRLAQNIRTFTHKDIINVTNANCPYSVLKSLKKYYEIEYKDTKRNTKKQDLNGNTKYVDIKFREYTIIKRKDNNVKESNIRGESKACQPPLIFLGESFS